MDRTTRPLNLKDSALFPENASAFFRCFFQNDEVLMSGHRKVFLPIVLYCSEGLAFSVYVTLYVRPYVLHILHVLFLRFNVRTS